VLNTSDKFQEISLQYANPAAAAIAPPFDEKRRMLAGLYPNGTYLADLYTIWYLPVAEQFKEQLAAKKARETEREIERETERETVRERRGATGSIINQ